MKRDFKFPYFVFFCLLVMGVSSSLTIVISRSSGSRRPAAPPHGEGFPPPPLLEAGGGRAASSPRDDLLAAVTPPAGREEREGIALAILIDTSGSMKGAARDLDGSTRTRFEVAKSACRRTLEKLEGFSRENRQKALKVGLYQFSGAACRRLLDLEPLRLSQALAALDRLTLGRGTPIGEAIITAKRDLDRSGLTRKHMLLLSDGENTQGRDPAAVARAIAALEPEDQAGIHFIAFGVEAARFNAIKEAGATVLEASSPVELDGCMDFILERKVLLELPEGARRK